jgi:hypothetical protein
LPFLQGCGFSDPRARIPHKFGTLIRTLENRKGAAPGDSTRRL